MRGMLTNNGGTVRRLLGTSIIVLALVMLGNPAARANIAFSQTVRLRNDPGPYYRTATSFPDGWGSCGSGCTTWPYPSGGERLTVMPRTYRVVDENRRYDYYLLDLDVTMTKRHGSKGYGYLDARVQSTKTVNYATWSLGKGTVGGCRKYPLDIGASFYGISVGTQVATFSVDCYDTSIKRASITRGQSYHVTNLGAVKHVAFQRFVRVAAGAHPKFAWKLTYPTDKCGKSYVNDGSNWVWQHWCTNKSSSIGGTIGTRG